MAIKDVEEYFDKVCEDYHDMIESLHDMEKEAEQNIISPERVESLKKEIEPMKVNYERISYIMYLLKKPGKFVQFLNKIGIKTKSSQYSHRVVGGNDLEAVRKENKKAINSIKK